MLQCAAFYFGLHIFNYLIPVPSGIFYSGETSQSSVLPSKLGYFFVTITLLKETIWVLKYLSVFFAHLPDGTHYHEHLTGLKYVKKQHIAFNPRCRFLKHKSGIFESVSRLRYF